MSLLDSAGVLLHGVGAVTRPVQRVEEAQRPEVQSVRALAPAPVPAPGAAPVPAVAPTPAAAPRAESRTPALRTPTALSAQSPEAIIRQAELLIQITAGAGSSPVLRQIAVAAYQMEIDARREVTRARLDGIASGRQWFA
ncbi:MAG: hypothetical protein ABSG17_16940 [Spirochaetia bacterium]|jgi:hypothetical protein